MPDYQATMNLINGAKLNQLFSVLYGKQDEIRKSQTLRYQSLLSNYRKYFSDGDLHLFSASGRTEIGGNHTDHNHGKVLTASINRDSIAVAAKTSGNEIIVYSDGYTEPFKINIQQLEKAAGEKGTNALIRGLLAGFSQFGYRIGAFNAYISSDVANGSGLSSSASIEMLLGLIINTFYNDGQADKIQLARIGQFAENKYWDKPSGLLDQMACAVGGMVTIDFENPEKPVVKQINFDFSAQQYSLVIVNTGSSHADLTVDYASIPSEMRSVAKFFEKTVCRQITYEQLLDNISQIRSLVGDRAVLRVMHFLAENRRVEEQVEMLESNRFDLFLELVRESGNSSWKWLQNCYPISTPREQGVPLALAITENFIHLNKKGVCRVHGGGFAGVIQVFLPNELVDKYIQIIDSVFGKNSASVMSIRPYGAIHINSLLG